MLAFQCNQTIQYNSFILCNERTPCINVHVSAILDKLFWCNYAHFEPFCMNYRNDEWKYILMFAISINITMHCIL